MKDDFYDTPDDQAGKLRCKWRVIFAVVAVVLFFALSSGVIAAQMVGPSWDRANANIATLICGFFALMTLLVAIGVLSPLPAPVSWAPMALFWLGIGGFFAVYKIESFSGTLIPSFRNRWQKAADEKLLGELGKRKPDIDLTSETEHDYPQFLGPARNQTLSGMHLATDWKSSPPKQLWRQRCGAGWSSFAARNGYAVTMEQRGPKELVTCYGIKSGKMQWWHAINARHETKLGGVGPRGTPTIHQGKVYALGATGVLRCLNGANGELSWKRNLLDEFGVAGPDEDRVEIRWGRSASPLVVDNVVIVPAGGPPGGPYVSLVAYNKDDGKFAWTSGDQQISYSSPALATIDGTRQIVIVDQSSVSGHKLDGEGETREVLWSHPWPGSSASAASTSQAVVFEDGRVFLSKGYGYGCALLQVSKNEAGAFTVEEIWVNPRAMKTKFTNVVVHDGYVFGLSDGILECIKLKTGKRQWKRGRYNHGQILLVDDLILVQAEDPGDLALVEANPNRFIELSRFPALKDKTWNNPCLYGRYLLVRNATEAACYELPVKETKPQ